MSNKTQINLETIPNIFCKCGCVFWDQVMLTKKVPGLMIGSSQDQFANVAVLICHDCGDILPQHEILLQKSKQIGEKGFNKVSSGTSHCFKKE